MSGRAFVTMGAVYMASCIISIYFFSAGIFYASLLEKYGEGEVKTNLIGALNSSLTCLLAPLASVFMNRYSCRITIVLGTILIAIGNMLSAWTTNITGLILTFGCVAGIGNAFASVPLQVVLSYYVEKRRHLVISAYAAFAGLGLYLSTPVTLFLLDQYGVHGAYLLMSGLALNLCITGVLCKPSSIELDLIKQHRDQWHGKKSNCFTDSAPKGSDGGYTDTHGSYKNGKKGVVQEITVATIYDPATCVPGSAYELKDYEFPTPASPYRNVCNITQRNMPSDKPSNPIPDHKLQTESDLHINVHSLVNPVFVLFLCSTCTWNLVLGTVVLNLPNYMQVTGKTKYDISVTMACFTISNVVGRFASMLISSKENVDGLIIYMVAMFISGAVSVGFPLYSSYAMANNFFATMTGFLMGAPNGIMASVTLKIAGINKLPTALSIVLFLSGIGLFVGPFIASALLEGFGSYSSTFLFVGGVSFIGALCATFAELRMRRGGFSPRK